MAKVFSITIPRNEINLDASRKGVAYYSVTNISDQPQKGQAVAHPSQANTAGWFSVNDPQRDFPAGRSSEVTVQIAVPRSAAVGTYSFELDIIRDGPEPLEDRTDQGQGATFEVKPMANRFPWWIPAAGAAALVLIIAIVLILANRPPGTVVVPDLLAMDPTRAARVLTDSGLQVGAVRNVPSNEVGQGLVAGSTPGARAELARGSRVDLVVSGGMTQSVVPDVRGLSLDQAKSSLAGVGLVVGSLSQANDANIPSGQVILSNPPAGQNLAPGSPVSLVISTGAVVSNSGNLDLTAVEHAFIYQPECKPECSDSTPTYLMLEDSYNGSGQFSFGLMRFDFGANLPAGAKITNFTLAFTVDKFSIETGPMEMYISAANQKWSGTKASYTCSGSEATVKISQNDYYKVDLSGLFAKEHDNVLNYGLCLVAKGPGRFVILGRDSPDVGQRPHLYISYQK